MKVINLLGREFKMYDSVDEMPIVNFQKYNKCLLIDSGIGSTVDDIDEHITKIAKYIKANNHKNALIELQNMRQNMYMINSGISPKFMAFAALIHSIDGKELNDLSDDSLKKIIDDIQKARHSKLLAFLYSVKKKLTRSWNRIFQKTL